MRNTLGVPAGLPGLRLVALAEYLASEATRKARPPSRSGADLECRADALFPGAGGLHLHVVGLASHGTWLVACAADPAGVLPLRDELMLMHRGSSRVLNTVNQALAQPSLLSADALDEEICEELTRVNHENMTLQRALSRSEAELARCSAERTRLLSMAAHELRGPLLEILNSSRLLESDMTEKLTSIQARHVARIREAGAALWASLEGLPDPESLEAGPLRLNKHTVHLVPLVKGAVVRTTAPAAQKGISVVAELAPDLPALHADGRRLREVMDQLLAHAIAFAPEQSRIRVRARADDPSALVCIVTHELGQGRAVDDSNRPEQTRGCAGARTVGPLGQDMRLAMVRRIIEAHGGVLDVCSLPDGPLFSLTLPKRHDD
jgi:signal transduction histidine kinase